MSPQPYFITDLIWFKHFCFCDVFTDKVREALCTANNHFVFFTFEPW